MNNRQCVGITRSIDAAQARMVLKHDRVASLLRSAPSSRKYIYVKLHCFYRSTHTPKRFPTDGDPHLDRRTTNTRWNPLFLCLQYYSFNTWAMMLLPNDSYDASWGDVEVAPQERSRASQHVGVILSHSARRRQKPRALPSMQSPMALEALAVHKTMFAPPRAISAAETSSAAESM